MRLREDYSALYNCQKGGCSKGSANLDYQVTSDRTEDNSLKLYQKSRKIFFTKRVARDWNRLSRKVVVLSSLETCGCGMALRDMV